MLVTDTRGACDGQVIRQWEARFNVCLVYKGEPIADVVIRQSLTRVSDSE